MAIRNEIDKALRVNRAASKKHEKLSAALAAARAQLHALEREMHDAAEALRSSRAKLLEVAEG